MSSAAEPRRTRRGRARARILRALTGAAVAAGAILTYSPPEEALAATTTFNVNSPSDAPDEDPGNGECRTASGTCTLRAAVQEANALAGPSIVNVPAGTYVLTRPGAAEDGGATGDLDVTGPLTVVGAGATATVVDGNEADRVFHLLETAGDVTLRGLTVRAGATEEEGAGVHSASPGTLVLDSVHVRDNTTVGDGGGVFTATGTLRIENGSEIADNSARSGGGVFAAGELTPNGLPSRTMVSNTTFTGNDASEGDGGAIVSDHEGALTLTDVTATGNFATGDGGAVIVGSKSSLTVTRGAFDENHAHGGGGAMATATERAVRITGTTFDANEAGVVHEGLPGEGHGGALSTDGTGAVDVTGVTFTGNRTPAEGGALHIANGGTTSVTDTSITGNHAGTGGGGIENAGDRVRLTRVTVADNEAELDGGGIESNGSGSFTVVDSTIRNNTAENGGGFANAADGATRIERTLIWDNRAVVGHSDDAGLGGGVYSLGDAGASYENVTIAGNLAQTRGGGFYVDADADVHVGQSTIVGNSAPIASGAGGEIGSVNFPVEPSTAVVFKNTVVAANLLGPNCSFAIGSEGGNLQGDTSCHFIGPRDRTVADPGLDAVADNGGPTMTMAIRPESLALDSGVSPCSATDARGVERPRNDLCDSGAFESEGPFPPADAEPPDTEYLTGPVQDTAETSAFTFTGSDNQTPAEHLVFECRLIETEPGEPPEPPDPTEPPDPELAWLGCQNPWQVPLVEEGLFRFEVRAVDRAGNVDPTPAVHEFGGNPDVTPPQTFFLETPPNPSTSRAAVFTVGATDDTTPAAFMEYECRIDTLDPDAWIECYNPIVFTNLSIGAHTVQARATDAFDNVDPSPATFTWTVTTAPDCDQANATITADADVYVDEELPEENFVVEPSLTVRSGDLSTNARALVGFPVVANHTPGCTLQSATLRLYAEGGDPDRILEATPAAGAWAENGVTWLNQPGVTGTPATTTSGPGYREWDVTAHVNAMIAGDLTEDSWVIADAVEDDAEGGEQSFASREAAQDPPEVTLPQLVLRYDSPGTPPPPAPTPGGPATLACGAVVTESVVLQNDLVGCLGEGLVVGADDIEIDLNGHRITSGVIAEPGEEDGLFAGIRNAGHDNVVIRGGTVRGFGYGLRLMGGARFNVVEGMTFAGNVIAGAELFDADDGRNGNALVDNHFELNGDGVALVAGTEGTTVTGNTFQGNVGRAVYLFDSSRNTIVDNTVSGLTNDPMLDSDGGIALEGSSGNVVSGNRVTDAGDAGVLVSAGSHRNRVEANHLSRNSDSGISVADSDGNEIVDNFAHLAGGAGVELSNAHDGTVTGNDLRFNPGGIAAGGSHRNLIEDNDVTHSSGDGIVVEAGLLNVIRANTATRTSGTGIVVEAEAVDLFGLPILGNTVEQNTANGNLGDGITVSLGGHVVTDNDAHDNASWGISAAELVVDGGGNAAGGNGEPEQCVGVVCEGGTAPPVPTDDLTAPDTQIVDAPGSGTSTFDPQTFTFTGTDDTAPADALRFECRLDPDPDPPGEPPEPGEPVEPPAPETWHECGSPVIYRLMPTGEHEFQVRAIDPFDNIDASPATHTWTVVASPPGPDALPPNTTIFEAPESPSPSSAATFGFRGTDNATPGPSLTYECSLDGAAFAACTSPVALTGLALGTHTFSVRAVDLQGNVDPTPATHSWTVVEPEPDTTAPDTTIDTHPDVTTVATDARFTFSSDEAGATFECALDGVSFAACTSPVSYGALSEGDHELQVRAVDAAGNEDPTPATFAWTVTAAPVDAEVSCGATITESTRVTNDLVDCSGNGLAIGAHGITLDLDGHVVDGTGTGFGVVNNGFDNVTIRNGVVQEFDAGVQLGNGTARNIVDGMTAQLNELAGVQLTNADDGVTGSVVRNNTVAGNGGGVLLVNGTQHARVHDNLIAGISGTSVHVLGSSANVVEANEITGSADGAVVLEGAAGNEVRGNVVVGSADVAITVHLGSDGNVVEGNDLSEGEAGVHVAHSNDNEVRGNIAQYMADAGLILEEAHDNLVVDNDVRFNTGGIELDGATGNRIEGNDASDTGGVGIAVGAGSVRNTIVANTANANDAGGIAVETFAAPGAGNVVDGNTTNDNTGDGLYVGDVGHVIVGNRADHNSEWGIYAADPTVAGMNVDGGGNRAAGNTGGEVNPLTLRPLQCKNVVCDGGPPLASDQVPPTTAISSAPVSPTVMTGATFRFTGSDNATAVTFECRLDSSDAADFEPCTSPAAYTGLAVGEHTFQVRSVDFVGNVDPTPATHTWVIEAPAPGVPPDTTIDSGPDTTTVATTASFTFSANEPGVTFECSLDGAAFTPCTSPLSLGGLTVGAHELRVRAIDSEDQPDPSPAAYPWTVSAPPVPASVSCGQLITVSTRLTNDLVDCSGNGLVIGAPGITVDLDGHMVDGVGLGAGVLDNGHDNVTVTNGAIQEFDHGVQLGDGSNGVVVSHLLLTVNQVAGIHLLDADGSTVRGNTLVDDELGIWLSDGTSGAVVVANTVTSSSLDGIRVEGADGNRVDGNTVRESGGGGVVLAGSDGNTVVDNALSLNSEGGVVVGEVELPADDNVVEGNTTTSNSGPGIAVVDATGNDLLGNVVTLGGSGGIELEGASQTLVRGNTLSGNSGGISLSESSDNRIEANDASGSNGTGIELEGGSLRNEIVLNNASGNSGEGIYVNDSTDVANGNLIDRNIASRNSGDGIVVNGAGHTVSGNAVSFNDGWGILAQPGVVDGGGNEAAGNAEPAQCQGVVCTIGVAPGAPDTAIVDKPDDPSSSANALFTFIGTDDTTSLFDLEFECRLDSTDPTDWVECDNPQQYTGLAPGEHTFEVRAVDIGELVDPTPASYTWVYQPLPAGVAPDTFIDLAPPLSSPLLEGFFTFSSNEPDTTFQCSLDGAPFTTCVFAYEFEFDEVQVGTHTFRVRAIDVEGLVDPTPATYTWVVTGLHTVVTDGPAYIPPTDPLEPAEGGETTATTAVLEFEANVADATFLCSLDLAPFTPCTSPVSYTGLAVGEHVFRVIATDPESEATQLEATEYTWTVIPGEDLVPPQTALALAPASGTSDAEFRFTGNDNVTQPGALTFECRLDSTDEADWIDCTSPFNLYEEYPDFAPGDHVFEVRANDNAEPLDPSSTSEGNVDPTPAVHEWTSVADVTAPTVALLTVPPASTIEPDVEVTFEGSDGNGTPVALLGFECSVDGAAFEPCESPFEVQGVDPGEHTVEVRSVDLAGNASTPASATWLLIGSPVTTISAGPDPVVAVRSADFTFSADQAGVTYECSVDGGAFVACSSPLALDGFPDGEHTLEIEATNPQGLVEASPAEWTWTVDGAPADTTAPDTTFTATPAATILVGETVFSFASSEVLATFECSLDGAPFAGCESPLELSSLLDGVHELRVRSIDSAGNADASPATFEWVVDLAPLAEILSGPADVSETPDAVFTFAANEPVAGFECFLDGVTSACTSPVTHPGLAAGPHVFAVRAIDDTASAPSEFEEHEWRIVAPAAPTTSFLVGPPAATTDTTASFLFTGTDNVTGAAELTFQCSLDGAAFTACTSPAEYAGLAVGDHTLAVRSVDGVGLTDPTPAQYSWSVLPDTTAPDTTAPETTITAGPSGTSTALDVSFTFTGTDDTTPAAELEFECSVDGASFATCTSPRNLTGVAVGNHDFRVRARDAAGNADPTPEQHLWTVVSPVPPDTTIVSGPPATTTDTVALFTFSSNQPDVGYECSLDGATFASCETPHELTGLPFGPHELRVRAVDPLDVPDPSPAVRSWTVQDPTPPPPACTTGAVTYTSNADSWINQGSPSDNKGTDSNLKVMSKAGNANRSLVRFNLPAQLPTGCVVQSATLRLYAGSSASGRTLQALRVASTWTENGVTWANQPTTTGTAITTTSGSGWRQWAVGPQVQAMFTPGANHGFLIRDAVENQDHEQQLHSREKAPDQPPQLIVTYGPPAP